MKRFGTFTTDGFRGSIEFPRFIRAVTNDLIAAISALVGNSPVFITGGAITEAGGNTTVTDGLLLVDGKIYTFTGGTYPGAPAALNILLQEQTAEGYPVPYLGTTPTDIYLDNVAKIDAAGSVILSTIGAAQSIQSTNSLINAQVTTINAALANKVEKGITWVAPNATISNTSALEASRPKIRASIDDTGILLIEFCFSTSVNIPAGSLICSFTNFLPGYVWTKCAPLSYMNNTQTGAINGHFSFRAIGQNLEVRNLVDIPTTNNWIVQSVSLIP